MSTHTHTAPHTLSLSHTRMCTFGYPYLKLSGSAPTRPDRGKLVISCSLALAAYISFSLSLSLALYARAALNCSDGSSVPSDPSIAAVYSVCRPQLQIRGRGRHCHRKIKICPKLAAKINRRTEKKTKKKQKKHTQQAKGTKRNENTTNTAK